MTTAYGLAARRPLAILVLLAAIAGGLTTAIWLLPLGLLAYATIVFLDGRTPALVAESQRPARPRLTSQTFRAQVDAIERTQQEIGRSAAQAGGPLARLLLPINNQAVDLVGDAYSLADRGQAIEEYLAGIDLRALQVDVSGIDAQLRTTGDAYTRDQLAETKRARQEKIANARDMTTKVGQINAQLQNIAATLDNVLAETVRLRTADAVSADAATSQVAGRLTDLRSDMEAFRMVLDSAITQTQTP